MGEFGQTIRGNFVRENHDSIDVNKAMESKNLLQPLLAIG